jgi:hypothetical protein
MSLSSDESEFTLPNIGTNSKLFLLAEDAAESSLSLNSNVFDTSAQSIKGSIIDSLTTTVHVNRRSLLGSASNTLIAARNVVIGLFIATEGSSTEDKEVDSSAADDVFTDSIANDFKAAHDANLTVEIGLERSLRCLVHECARTAIESDTVEFMSELRSVVTIFIEVVSEIPLFSRSDGHPCIQNVVSAIFQSTDVKGGSVRQVVLDDKGFVFILAFGLSGSSYSDSSIRAVDLAFLVRSSVRALEQALDVKIGITSGDSVFCGVVGHPTRGEFMMMGNSVNLSARLMKQCQLGAILVDSTVFLQAQDFFEFEEECHVVAKGNFVYHICIAIYN